MQENKLLAAGAVYGMDVVAQTFKSINAFEVTYNGVVRHSKLKTGAFPDPTAIALKPYPKSRVAPVLKKYNLFK